MDSALERAADLLGRARFPVIGGLFTDIGGAAAALALAEKLGGAVDHAAGTGLSRASRVMRETGATPASFGEVRNRADTVVVIGKGPLERDPDLIAKLFPGKPGLPRPGDNQREVIFLGLDKVRTPRHVRSSSIRGRASLPELVALLAANVRETRFDIRDKALRTKLNRAGERIRKSAFAVFVYDPADGVNLCSTWTCGLPVRTSFAREVPEHDAWAYETERLLETGEADALVWIDALEGEGTKRPKGAPTVVLSSSPGRASKGDVVIEVASAAGDHDAALYLSPISGIGMVKAGKANRDKSTVADVLTRIAELIDARNA